MPAPSLPLSREDRLAGRDRQPGAMAEIVINDNPDAESRYTVLASATRVQNGGIWYRFDARTGKYEPER